MDRSKPPLMKPIKQVVLPKHSVRQYPNGLKLIIINAGVHEVFKLETIFNAGRFHEKKKLVSGATLQMIKEGTKAYSAEDIAETMDFYGASLSTPTNLDVSSLTLYGLNQHFQKLLPVYQSIVTSPTFPETEFKDYVMERKQQLQVDLSKNDVIAYRKVTEAIYGDVHPYGYNSDNALYDDLEISDLKEHFERNYRTGNCTVVFSGKISEEMIQELEKSFFPLIPEGKSSPIDHVIKPNKDLIQFIPKENAVQTAIRVGCRLFGKEHPDYCGMYFLNIILGDYFSSRLMMNIREDKGYTYSIYSMLDMMEKDGLFLISTETANEHTEDLLKEIRIEFERLKVELIPSEELEMARNFTLGTLLSSLDGAFNSSGIIKNIYLDGLDETHFYSLVETIKTISGKELMHLAQKYLNLDKMFTVMVGKKIVS